jgi:DNA-binding response OmpR family regulator
MDQPVNVTKPRLPIVLIIDDNPAIRDMVSWALELDGYEPAEASEGNEALAWIDNATREGRFPSVILLDLAMPGMDGPTFLSELRLNWKIDQPFPAIVIITAAHTLPESITPGSPDIAQVVVKPFHVRHLLDMIHQLMLP